MSKKQNVANNANVNSNKQETNMETMLKKQNVANNANVNSNKQETNMETTNRTLVAQINATARKAIVIVDDNDPIVCSLKKEGNGSYSIVFKNKIDWPTNFYNIGKLDGDKTINTTEQECIGRKSSHTANGTTTTSNTKPTVRVGSIVAHLRADIETLRGMEGAATSEELYILESMTNRLDHVISIRQIEEQITKLQEQLVEMKKTDR